MDTGLCFSEFEARKHIGAEVVSRRPIPSVPVGTRGKVVGVARKRDRGWVLRVEWDLPLLPRDVLAIVGDFSFNLPWKSKVPDSELSKEEAERLLERVEN